MVNLASLAFLFNSEALRRDASMEKASNDNRIIKSTSTNHTVSSRPNTHSCYGDG